MKMLDFCLLVFSQLLVINFTTHSQQLPSDKQVIIELSISDSRQEMFQDLHSKSEVNYFIWFKDCLSLILSPPERAKHYCH